jgi:hypothetical protein
VTPTSPTPGPHRRSIPPEIGLDFGARQATIIYTGDQVAFPGSDAASGAQNLPPEVLQNVTTCYTNEAGIRDETPGKQAFRAISPAEGVRQLIYGRRAIPRNGLNAARPTKRRLSHQVIHVRKSVR